MNTARTIIAAMTAVTISACSTSPANLNRSSVKEVDNTALCQGYLHIGLTGRQKRAQGITEEIHNRGLGESACFGIIVSQYGIDSICKDYMRSIRRERGYTPVGYGFDMSNQDVAKLTSEEGVDCTPFDPGVRRSGGYSSSDYYKMGRDIFAPSSKSPSTTSCVRYGDDLIQCSTN